jgi:protein-L-isoaspartate(D-aspartate) O-methyltransferase
MPVAPNQIIPAGCVLCLTLSLAPACQPQARSGGAEPREPSEQQPANTSASLDATRRGPRSDEAAAQRRAMVEHQIEARGVRDPDVLEAMRNVPRHWFVPDDVRRFAYADRPLRIGEGQTISQPYIVALMTDALDLTRESKVLEIGTGSGYQAAVLSEITPHVYTIEIVEPLARRAIAAFKEHGYETIEARIGDGYAGWPEHAPFDAVIVTCAPDHIPQKLVEQLDVGGRLCIPVGTERGVQELILATKRQDGSLDRTSLIPVRFVPMTGEAQTAGPE